MKINSEFIWEKNLKEVNEDALCICHVKYNNEPLVMAAVCDGVGGLPNGENASSLVISSIKNQFYQLPRNSSINLKKMAAHFSRCLFSCNKEIKHGATTICLVLIYRKRCLIISYGDSRIYIGNTKLKPVTPCHTDSLGHLTHAVGAGTFKKPFITYRSINYNTTFLLCTDGFYNRSHALITQKNFFKDCNTNEKWLSILQRLYSTAVNKGEKDNSTAIAIWYER